MSEWKAIQNVGKRGTGRTFRLLDPDGDQVATFSDDAAARHCAAAMNLTTPQQRIEFLAGQAGYGAARFILPAHIYDAAENAGVDMKPYVKAADRIPDR